MNTDLGPWEPLTVAEVSAALTGFDRPWWIAGGWAIDLHLGQQTRAHDVDHLEGQGIGEVRLTIPGWPGSERQSGLAAPSL